MRIHRTNRVDRGSILKQTDDDRNKDPRVQMIRKVQHLIERCLLFRMDLNGCVGTLAKHANIHPLLTIAVWKGLLRENGEFFRAYFISNVRLYNPTPAHTAAKSSSTNILKSSSHVLCSGSDSGRPAARTI